MLVYKIGLQALCKCPENPPLKAYIMAVQGVKTLLSDLEIKAHEALESEEDAFWIWYDDETAVA